VKKRRQLVVEGQNFTKDLQNAYSVHEKTLSNRNKFKKTTYKAKLELDEAEKKGKAEKIAKKKIKHDQDKEKSEQAELQYKEAVKELDFHQTKWLSDAMPRILTELQSIEEKRLFIYKNTMISLSGFFEGLPQFFTNCGNTIHQLSNAINPTADLQTFIDENRTDDVPPPQIKYEEWSPNMDEKKRKKEAAAIFSIGKKKAPAKSKKPLPAVAPSTVAASNVPPVNIESIRRPTPDDPVLSPRTKDELKKPKAKVPEGGLTKVQEARIKMEADAAKAKATEFKKDALPGAANKKWSVDTSYLEKQKMLSKDPINQTTETDVHGGRRVYGLDAELADKQKEKSDPELESHCKQWISQMIGEKIDGDLSEALKSGVILCKLLNKIKPNTIEKFNTKNVPLAERENIRAYLDGVKKVGLSQSDLFMVSDLYEKKDLTAVWAHINALRRSQDTKKEAGSPGAGRKQSEPEEEEDDEEEEEDEEDEESEEEEEEEEDTTVKAKALANFKAENEDEVSFKKGDIVEVVEEEDTGWWTVEINGKTGAVPGNYFMKL